MLRKSNLLNVRLFKLKKIALLRQTIIFRIFYSESNDKHFLHNFFYNQKTAHNCF